MWPQRDGCNPPGGLPCAGSAHPENPDAFKGTIKYIGTPAEESSSGREVMACGGAFKPEDMDACIMVHSYGYELADQVWLGRRVLNVTFHGVAAHASSQPFMGRNALDAAAMTYQGFAVLRQQVPPSDRIHAMITKGGTRQSIITEEAEMKFYVRSKYPDTLKDLSRRVENVVKGAAQMTDCGVDIEWDFSPATPGVRANDQLVSRWVEAQRRRGREPLPRGVVSEILAASTDFGNVSYRVPGIHPLIKVANEDQALHTREFEASVGTEKGDRGAVDGAYGLAQVLLDFLTDVDQRKPVKDDSKLPATPSTLRTTSTNSQNLEGQHPRDWALPSSRIYPDQLFWTSGQWAN